MSRTTLTIVVVLAMMWAAAAQETKAPSWEPWKFLLGDWVAEEAGGAPGQASGGGSTFRTELGGRVLLRTNRAEYPATKEHAAFVHEDLMVVYAETGGRVRADYWDNEGHLIHYTATADGQSARFLSDEITSQPRYRLTYVRAGENRLKVTFEIAPPGKPNEFRKYVEGTVRRRSL